MSTVKGRVSVVIPSRAERFVAKTALDILAKAQGDIEVIVMHDGPPTTLIPADPRGRLRQIVNPEPIGMRPAINMGMAAATGEFLMKLDGHCLLGEGFDEILKADCDSDWIVVPRRVSLEPESWTILETGRAPVDAHYLSSPFDLNPSRPGLGLQGIVWKERAKIQLAQPLTPEMASQGSCYFMSRKHWDRLGPMDTARYGDFIQEAQSLMLPTWLGGGRCVVNKRTFYAHLYKGKKYGRGYPLPKGSMEKGWRFCLDYWLNDRWPERTRNFASLIEQFWPVPGWSENWQEQHAARMAAGGYL